MSDTAEQIIRNQLVTGDCLQTMAQLPAQSVDLIFTDPPYNIGFKYDQYEDTRHDEDYVQWTLQWIDACARLLKPTGSFYILIGDEYAGEARVHLKQLEREKKLVFRNWIIWHYTFGQNCKIKFNRSHAHLFYCVGSATIDFVGDFVNEHPFVFNRPAIAIPSARLTTYGDVRANPKGKLPDDTWYLRPQEATGTYFSPDEDTWYQSRLCGTFRERTGWHPCQLPQALLERIIKLSSNPGQLVFDPFAGSGTTLAVAKRLGRDWLGCELSEDYAKRALERIDATPILGEETVELSQDSWKKPKRRRRKNKSAENQQPQETHAKTQVSHANTQSHEEEISEAELNEDKEIQPQMNTDKHG